ncbi:MAG: sulfurtransferase TusA family protein [Thermoplasmata archaeon]
MAAQRVVPDRVSDQLGLYCPEPIFRTRQELDDMKPGEILEVVADDPATAEDIPRLVKRTGNELVDFYRADGVNHFIIRKTSG